MANKRENTRPSNVRPPLSRETGNWSGMPEEKRRPGNKDGEQAGQREYTDDYPSYGSQYGRDKDFDPERKGKLPPELPVAPGKGKTPV